MEGRICFESRWGLKPVLIYALCHTKPIFDFDYRNKRSKPPNNMSSRKRSNTYWLTNTFAPSVAICIARIICHRLSAAICIGRPICLCSNAAICINRSISLKSSNMYWSTNMSSRIDSKMHWLHQYATKFNIIYYTYWNSYRIVQGIKHFTLENVVREDHPGFQDATLIMEDQPIVYVSSRYRPY